MKKQNNTISKPFLVRAAETLVRVHRSIDAFKGKKIAGKRSFAAAQGGRLLADWMTSNTDSDSELWSSLQKMRDRSREMERSDDYWSGFLKKADTNILGSFGIRMICMSKEFDGRPDKRANAEITGAWKIFSKLGNCDVTKTLSMRDASALVLRTLIRDGEVLVRKVKGFNNKYRFALQILEPDYLDHNYNARLASGNEVKMGVEKNEWGEPVAYWIFKSHPGNIQFANYNGTERIRVEASEMMHLFIPLRTGQTRGYPWGVTSFLKLRHLKEYEQAEVIAARIGACKMGFAIRTTPQDWDGEIEDDDSLVQEMEPGTIEELPQGYDFKDWDPSHPNGNFSDFRKAVLRGIAVGLGISYTSLASDLESVNYSSARVGILEEREYWKILQFWFIEHFMWPVFEEFLTAYMMGPDSTLPMSKFDKFNSPLWFTRKWPWIDPTKDLDAAERAIKLKVKTRGEVIQEMSETHFDFEDVATVLEEENKIMKNHKIEDIVSAPGSPGGGPPPAKKPAPKESDDEEDS